MYTLNEVVSSAKVGGKAFRLAKMANAGMNVPKTLIISISEVRNIIEKQSVSEDILNRIFSTLSFVKAGVAVRSTGDGEDSTKLSWAGQFMSKLCVKRESLASAILECANAQVAESVLSYARQHDVVIPPLALIVQEMVDALYAGVLFPYDPVTGDNHIVVELTDGYGEDLVSGLKSGERIAIDPISRKVISQEGKSFNLPNNLISKLVDLSLAGKTLFGSHQDMEFAYEKNSCLLYALQSRDVTTIQPRKIDIEKVRTKVIEKTDNAIQKEIVRLRKLGLNVSSDVLSDQNIAEILTLNPTTMTLGLFNYVFAHGDGAICTARREMGYEIGEELNTGYFMFVGGQPRCSIVHEALLYRVQGMPLKDYSIIVREYLTAIDKDPKMANYSSVVLYDQNPSLEKLTSLFGNKKAVRYKKSYDVFHAKLRELMKVLDTQCRDEFIPMWKQNIVREEGIENTNLKECVSQYMRLTEMLRTQACPMFVKAARIGFLAYAELRTKLISLYGNKGEQYANTLTSGIPLELNPNLRFSIELAKLRDGLVSQEDVSKTFGHLSVHELEIGTPRYHEKPEIFQTLADCLSDNPLTTLEDTANRYSVLRLKLIDETKDIADAKVLNRLIDTARKYLSLREVVKFEFLRAYDLVRKNTIAIEKRLGWDEGIIFYLYPQEVFVLQKNHEALKTIATNRKSKHDSSRALFVPSVIYSTNLNTIGVVPKDDGKNLFRGLGVTNVSSSGKVVVIHNLDDKKALASLKPGSILVTKTTDPAWSPILSIVGKEGGLITEVGGLLAHGAIYARETGLAAVLNIPGITSKLKTGMKVFVNGSTGTVEVLS